MMAGRLFPKNFDNAYRGHWPGIWPFAAAAVSLFALLGLGRLLATFLGVLTLFGCRATIPLLHLLFLALHLETKVVTAIRSIAHSGVESATAGSIAIHATIAALAIGFVLSLMHRTKEAAP